jgi:hypothetical protein
MTTERPQSLGGYRLIEPIGRGGMGEVWRAERLGPGGARRRAAVKRIAPAQHGDPTLRARFLAEARITARLEHPNVVHVLDFGDDPELFLVLEYVEGASLADLMRRAVTGGGFPAAAALFVVAEAAAGLDYAHRLADEGRALGIVHRDVSPPNILVSVDGAVKVGDFGIARAADNLLRTQAGMQLGKLVYMAPEQARGERVDHRADVFALGVVLWEALTLRPLLPRESPAQVLEALERCDFPPPSTFVPGLPAVVDDIVRSALAHDPDRRTGSAGRMERALRGALHAMAPGFDARDLGRIVAHLAPSTASRRSLEPLTPVPATPVARPLAPLPASTPTRLAAVGPLADARLPVAERARAGPVASAASEAPREITAPPRSSSPAPRRPRPWLLGVALLVAALGAALALVLALQDEPAITPSLPTAPPGVQQALGIALVTAARACALRLGVPVHAGAATMEASYAAAGHPTQLRVRVVATGASDATLASCVEQTMRAVPVPPSAEGVSVAPFTVSF